MSTDICPNGCDLRGEPIKQEYIDAGMYGDRTHYSRMIGVDGGRLGIYDGVAWWVCPDCGVRWHRFASDDPWSARIRAAVESAWDQPWPA